MKKANPLLLTFLFVSCFIQHLHAQTSFFPQGTEWFYTFKNYGLIQSRGFTQYTYSGDTLLLSQNAKIITSKTYFTDFSDPTIVIDTIENYSLILNQSGDSIQYYSNGEFKLLWRTGLSAGATFEVEKYGLFYTMTVDSTAYTTIGGQQIKQTWIKGTNQWIGGGSELIYDYFGPSSGFFYSNCWGAYDCFPPSLCKYKNNQTGVLDFNGLFCENITGVSEEFTNWNVRIFPNPFSALFQIDLQDNQEDIKLYQIYNQTGELLLSNTINALKRQAVDMSAFIPGIYYCRVLSENGSKVYKLVKQE